MFTKAGSGGDWVGARVCAFDRSKMLSSDKAVRDIAQMKCFDHRLEDGSPVGGVLPADIDGATLPPTGSLQYVAGFGVDQLRLWRIHMDWTNISNSKISGPSFVNVAPFQAGTCGRPRNQCIPQKDTSELLEALPDRLMYRLSYRSLGDREILLTNHTVKTNHGFGVRWYELSRSLPAALSTEFTVRQQQTFGPDDTYRWIGSMASEKFGNILLTYNVSDKNSHPSLRFAGRQAKDPLSVLSTEGVLAEGKRSVGDSRWGDYGSVSLDPKDDCTFWITGQYLSGGNPSTGAQVARNQSGTTDQISRGDTVISSTSKPDMLLSDNVVTGYYWDTLIASIRFPECK